MQKKNGIYYAVIACSDTKPKTIWIVSTFINKKEASQFLNDSNEPLRYTPKNVYAEASTESILQEEYNVNAKSSKTVDTKGNEDYVLLSGLVDDEYFIPAEFNIKCCPNL